MARDPVALREGLVRQRRLLVTVSSLLTFFVTAVGPLDKLVVFGNPIPIERPALALVFLWVAWFYVLVRYYQYFRELAPEDVRLTINERLRALADKHAKQVFKGRQGKSEVVRVLATLGVDAVVHPLMEKEDGLEWSKELIDKYDMTWNVKFIGSTETTSEDGGTTTTSQPTEIQVTRDEITLPLFRAWCWSIVNRTAFTEYVLPFFVAAVPVVSQAVKWIVS